MSRSMVFGLLRFPACDIGNQFRLRGASLKVDSGAALMVNGSRFGRDVELNNGLLSIGALVLDQVRIPGQLDFSQSKIKSAAVAREGRPLPTVREPSSSCDSTDWDENAISLADAEVKRLFMPETRDERPRGIVDFSRASAASYQDFAAAWTPGSQLRGKSADGRDIDHLVLDGFTYEHLNNPSGSRQGPDKSAHSKADDGSPVSGLNGSRGSRIATSATISNPSPGCSWRIDCISKATTRTPARFPSRADAWSAAVTQHARCSAGRVDSSIFSPSTALIRGARWHGWWHSSRCSRDSGHARAGNAPIPDTAMNLCSS